MQALLIAEQQRCEQLETKIKSLESKLQQYSKFEEAIWHNDGSALCCQQCQREEFLCDQCWLHLAQLAYSAQLPKRCWSCYQTFDAGS